MFTEGIFPIGDGLLDIDEARLKSLLVQDDINEIYEIEQNPFARGKFAAVRRAVHKNSGVHFAAKFLKRRRRAQSSDKEIKHEIAVLTLCDGAENIVKLNAVHESRSDTALLLELATGGELQTLLDNEECLSEAHARYCMREVLKALQFLHKRSIAHLDLKPQNILLIGDQVEDGIKLCDFGISRVVAEGTNVREILGTPDYVAPEVLQYEPLSLLTDIWSVGVLTYVLLSGFSPFGGDSKQETFLNISQCALTFPDKLFGGVSAAAIDFIRRALRIKPNDRMTAAGCLEHFWLKDDCSIERHIFENKKSLIADNEPENDEDVDDEDDEEEEDEEEEDHNISIETDENGDAEDISDQNITTTNGVKTNGTFSLNGLYKNKTTTTVVHTVPAARATTIPLCNAQPQPQQQQQQQQTTRRHSTDSNKENTYLATKKIMPANNVNIAKKSTIATTNKTTTATIIIATDQKKLQQQQHREENEECEANNIIATITLPNVSNNVISTVNSSSSNGIISAAPSLFPDAPTTPKVIRKAPNTDEDDDDDTSPTSVKALVKKFQLEGTEKHLKETQSNQQQQQQHIAHVVGPRKSLPTSISGKLAASMAAHSNNENSSATKKLPEKCTNIYHQHQQYSNNNNNNKHISNIITNSSSRRLSEPLTAVHYQKKLTSNSSSSSNNTTTKTTTPTQSLSPLSSKASETTAALSYKTTCVYSLTCGGNATDCCDSTESSSNNVTNGCRHSTATISVNASTSAAASSATFNAVNGVSTNGRTTTMLLSSNHHHRQQQQLHHLHQTPHQHHHHHNHHHVVVAAKNVAANNLSLDQGIIC